MDKSEQRSFAQPLNWWADAFCDGKTMRVAPLLKNKVLVSHQIKPDNLCHGGPEAVGRVHVARQSKGFSPIC